jgi:hypothetical protein
LLVAAAASMDFVGHGAGFFFELTDDEGVDVFVGGAVEVVGRGAFGGDGVEGGDDGLTLFGGEDADGFEGASEGFGASEIGFDQEFVEVEGLGEFFEILVLAGFKAATVEFVLHCFLLS